jgi:integrase/recombinase XerD
MIMTQMFEHGPAAAREGSLRAFVPMFAEQMCAQGYAPASVKASTRLVHDFVVWLDQRGIEGGNLSTASAAEYLTERWLHRCRRRGDAFTLRSFVRFAAGDGPAAPPDPRSVTTPARWVRQTFEGYLEHERGLAAATVGLYGNAIGRFLEHAFGDGEVQLGELDAADIVRFVQAEATRLHHSKRAKVMTSALRAFLQYGRYHGDRFSPHSWNSGKPSTSPQPWR